MTPADRSSFKRCRRAWDFGAESRQRLRPRNSSSGPDVATALRRALEVYYFPGMWAWPRPVVLPLVHAAYERAMAQVSSEPPPRAEDLSAGHRFLDAYSLWAPTEDVFTPMQVAIDLEINVPDPVLSDRDLVTPEGQAVRFCTWLDGIVFGDDDRPWLLLHRFVTRWYPTEILGVEMDALTDGWAWTHYALDPRLGGVLFNELFVHGSAGESFRRTVVPATGAELAAAGRQLGYEVLDMVDAGLVLYPNPTMANCEPCQFLAPCRAVRTSGSAAVALSDLYERRGAEPLVEGRLGGRTWSMSRGARPNRFDT